MYMKTFLNLKIQNLAMLASTTGFTLGVLRCYLRDRRDYKGGPPPAFPV